MSRSRRSTVLSLTSIEDTRCERVMEDTWPDWIHSVSTIVPITGLILNLLALAVQIQGEEAGPLARHQFILQNFIDSLLCLFTVPVILQPNLDVLFTVHAGLLAVSIWNRILTCVCRTWVVLYPFHHHIHVTNSLKCLVWTVYTSEILVLVYAVTFHMVLLCSDIQLHFTFCMDHDTQLILSWINLCQGWILPGVLMITITFAFVVKACIGGGTRQTKKIQRNIGLNSTVTILLLIPSTFHYYHNPAAWLHTQERTLLPLVAVLVPCLHPVIHAVFSNSFRTDGRRLLEKLRH